MDVSVIIVNWRSKAFLQKCLQTLYASTSGVEFEVIVVDNASFDGCDRMLAEQFLQVRFIQSAENVGFAGANNIGVVHATGNAILFLNPDTEIIGPAIPTLWSAICEHSDAGAVGPRILNSDGSLQTSCVQPFPTILNQVLDADYLQRKFPQFRLWGIQPAFDPHAMPQPVECISGACLMVRRSVLEQAGGGFSSLYFMYTEDLDLCRRVESHGWKVYHVPAAEIVHHGGGSSKAEQSNFSAVMVRESLFRYMREWHGTAYALAYRAAIGAAGTARVLLSLAGLLVARDSARRQRLKSACRKWTAIVRWACGLERWAGRTKAAPSGATTSMAVGTQAVQ